MFIDFMFSKLPNRTTKIYIILLSKYSSHSDYITIFKNNSKDFKNLIKYVFIYAFAFYKRDTISENI